MATEIIILSWAIGGLFLGLAVGVRQERARARANPKDRNGMLQPGTMTFWTWVGAPAVVAGGIIFGVMAVVIAGYSTLIVKLARTHTLPEVRERKTQEADRVLDDAWLEARWDGNGKEADIEKVVKAIHARHKEGR